MGAVLEVITCMLAGAMLGALAGAAAMLLILRREHDHHDC